MAKEGETAKREMKTERVYYVDIARGIAIIFMIVGHLGLGYNPMTKMIYSFHMPLFIIVSGMFFNEKEKFSTLIVKIGKKLLLLYVISILFVSLISSLLYGREFSIINVLKQIILAYSNYKTFFADTLTVGVLWFIPFLAIMKMLFYLVRKISNNDYVIGIMSFMFTLAGIILARNSIFLPWSFDIALSSMIFFYVGYVLKKYNYLEKILDNNIVVILLFIIWFIALSYHNIELAVRSYSVTAYIAAIVGTIVVFKMSKIVHKFFQYLSEILMWYGKNSLYIICGHYIELKLIQYENFPINNGGELFVVKILIITLITYISTNIIKLLKSKYIHNNEKQFV